MARLAPRYIRSSRSCAGGPPGPVGHRAYSADVDDGDERTAVSYSSFISSGGPGRAAPDEEPGPELADIGKLARRLVRRATAAARAEDEEPVPRELQRHLGRDVTELPVVGSSWPAYDHVNVQRGLDAWLARDGRRHRLIGLRGYRHRDFGLPDLLQAGGDAGGIGLGSVARVAQLAGPDGQTLACVQCGVYLVEDGDVRIALLLRSPEEHAHSDVTIEVCAPDETAAQQVLDGIRELALELNVFRGHVITFGGEVFGHRRDALLQYLDRPRLDRSAVILPDDVLDGIERQVVGIAEHAGALRASGQHLKRGVLLHGPPGTGKTHTVRYLLGQRPDATAIVISGYALRWIAQACSVARALQPSIIVIEDVDLIAEERGSHGSENAMLFQLLNEMDGLGSDVDVTFLLTTNRADLLEEALAARPGRVDHAAELPVPDGDGRRRLMALYRGSLALELTDPDAVVERTAGVTASFLKELLRRAALVAAERDPGPAGGEAALRVTDEDMSAALDQLLDTRSQLTRILLGARAGHDEATD
jgi:ATPase family associated with various cellular activities (AAA)